MRVFYNDNEAYCVRWMENLAAKGPRLHGDTPMRISVMIEREVDGAFHAYCPGLKGVHAGGETEEEALDRVKDAIRVYLRSVADRGDIDLFVCVSTEWRPPEERGKE